MHEFWRMVRSFLADGTKIFGGPSVVNEFWRYVRLILADDAAEVLAVMIHSAMFTLAIFPHGLKNFQLKSLLQNETWITKTTRNFLLVGDGVCRVRLSEKKWAKVTDGWGERCDHVHNLHVLILFE